MRKQKRSYPASVVVVVVGGVLYDEAYAVTRLSGGSLPPPNPLPSARRGPLDPHLVEVLHYFLPIDCLALPRSARGCGSLENHGGFRGLMKHDEGLRTHCFSDCSWSSLVRRVGGKKKMAARSSPRHFNRTFSDSLCLGNWTSFLEHHRASVCSFTSVS